MQDRSALAPSWQRAFDWVEQTVGGALVGWESQARWRPAWFLEVERAGERVPLYWRGARPEFHGDARPLAREMQIIEVLERQGIPVPHPYGLCEDPPGLLLERCRGRVNLATADDEAERVSVLDHYIDLLVRVHAIDPAELEAIGLRRPRDAARSCLGELPHFERIYRSQKRRPEPMIEFLLGWVRRNVPHDREQISFVLCDSGQFLFDRGRVTGLIDFELAYLGDAAADLAGLRTRDLSEPLGDLDRALRRYAEQTGAAVDPRVVDYHTIRFSLANPLSMAHLCAAPEPSLNFAQYLTWYVVYSRCALEVLAHATGIELERPSLPESAPSRRGIAHGHLVAGLDPAQADDDPQRAYDLDRHRRVAEYLERSDRYGPALASDDQSEAADVLGHHPQTWQEADAALEALVLEAGPERDPELARLFYRRLVREEALLGPALRELEGAHMPPLDR